MRSYNNLIGLLLIILGVFSVGYGIQTTQTWINKIFGGITNRYTNRTLWFLIGGILLILSGTALMFLGESGQPPVQPY